MKKCISLILLLSILVLTITACAPETEQGPLEIPQADNIAGKAADMAFETAYMEFAVKLLQKSAAEKQGENLMISPLSVQLALAMTANGAEGQTLQELESVLSSDMPIEELNEYLYGYLYDHTDGLAHHEESKLKIANSVWLRDKKDRLQVDENFLQSVSNYYDADIYKRAFDNMTLKQINNWADQNTDGMIPEILDKIDGNTMMYLINAITFDAQWVDPYNEYAIHDGSFTTLTGKKQTVSMMHGEETMYLEDNRAAGFLKPYSGGRYSFAVLVPQEDVDIYDYLNSLTAEDLAQTLYEAQACTVFTQLPKFSYSFDMNMNDVLKDMGMTTAFDPVAADLSRLGTSSDGNIYIGNVLHKTFIRVDGKGTQAGAITAVEAPAGAAMDPDRVVKEVIVDRPFICMILDTETNFPIFMGCVTEITE